MTDGLAIQHGIQQITEQTIQESSAGIQKQPDEADISKFNDVLNASQETGQVQPQQTVQETANVELEPSQKTMGDSLLEGIERSRTAYEGHISNINEMVNKASGEEMTSSELMKMQFELMELNMQQDLTSKVADKSSQGVQTLFRNQ